MTACRVACPCLFGANGLVRSTTRPTDRPSCSVMVRETGAYRSVPPIRTEGLGRLADPHIGPGGGHDEI